jgi:hypothetical protein
MMLKRFRPDAAAIINRLLSKNLPGGSREDAERQAKRIREYWLALGQPKTVDVRYVQGRGGYTGSWSPVILDEMVWCAPEVERMKR